MPRVTTIPVATLQEGSFFGELGLLAGEPRSGHVKAVVPVLAAEIDQKGYQVLNRVFPEFNARLMQLLEKRVAKRKVQVAGRAGKVGKRSFPQPYFPSRADE